MLVPVGPKRGAIHVPSDKTVFKNLISRKEALMNGLGKLIAQIEPVPESWIRRAMTRQDSLTKPPGSLGLLEKIASRVVAIQQSLSPNVEHKRILVFAADHGVVEEGVSPYPQEVTAQMVANFLREGAAINAMARAAGAEVVVINIGVKHPIPPVEIENPSIQFIDRPVRNGTRNLLREPALTVDEAVAAIMLGTEIAMESAAAGVGLIGLGEMGIGNTTASAAITAALTGSPSSAVTGRGTGADDEMLAKKQSVIAKALELHADQLSDPLGMLSAIGGLELAGLVGVCLGAAANRIPVVLDGFITTAAAAIAVEMCPAVADYLFAGHLSVERGHAALLERLRLQAMLNLEMRLGEGTGAAIAMKVIESAVRAFAEMATFESAGVSDKHDVAQRVAR
jgi:nicotinate-nucleotide--dimethylbenzimidazole phosphoribosyltransferase